MYFVFNLFVLFFLVKYNWVNRRKWLWNFMKFYIFCMLFLFVVLVMILFKYNSCLFFNKELIIWGVFIVYVVYVLCMSVK